MNTVCSDSDITGLRQGKSIVPARYDPSKAVEARHVGLSPASNAPPSLTLLHTDVHLIPVDICHVEIGRFTYSQALWLTCH